MRQLSFRNVTLLTAPFQIPEHQSYSSFKPVFDTLIDSLIIIDYSN